MKAEIIEGVLVINEIPVKTDRIVKELAFYKEFVVVLYKSIRSPDNNVAMFDQSGAEVWRAPFANYDLSSSGNYYSGVGFYEGELRVFHLQGFYYVADPIMNTLIKIKNGRLW